VELCGHSSVLAGKFLVRDQLKARPEHYFLSILQGGEPTHHRISRYVNPEAVMSDSTSLGSVQPDGNAPFVIDGMTTPARTLADLIEMLRNPQPLWATPLTSDLISPAAVR
jgi:hypothetical protein